MVFGRNEREPWQPDDESTEDGWSLEHPLGDPDAWRGEAMSDAGNAWREPPAWTEWPEWNAGPEYQMWKRMAEEE
ncbi:MAG TPA: hypothetical protein VF166_13310 [Gemmatimonadaceae bacterium]